VAGPWISGLTILFFPLLGGFITACKGRSVGWGMLFGLLIPVYAHAAMLGLESHPYSREPILIALLGILTLGCATVVLALLAAILG
jgi:hypothetical protein